jgi:phage terminase Nu1 subunit (DNA packaging protein)
VLVMRGGKVDVAASDAVLDDRPERVSEAATAATVEAGPQSTTYAQAKLADMVFRAKLRRLEFESRSGKLIPMDEVKVQWFKLGRQIRDKLLAMPAKLAPQLAALGDTREVRELLDAEIEAIVRALQDDIRYRRH